MKKIVSVLSLLIVSWFCYAQKDEANQETTLLHKKFQKDPSPENAYHLGLAYHKEKDYMKAVVYLSKATLKNVDPALASNAYLYRGLTRIRQNNFNDGFIDLRKSLALNPKNAEVYRYRGLAEISTEEYIKAIQDFSTYTMYTDKSWESYNTLANDILKSGTTNKDLIEKAHDLALLSAEKNKNKVNEQTLNEITTSLKKSSTEGIREIPPIEETKIVKPNENSAVVVSKNPSEKKNINEASSTKIVTPKKEEVTVIVNTSKVVENLELATNKKSSEKKNNINETSTTKIAANKKEEIAVVTTPKVVANQELATSKTLSEKKINPNETVSTTINPVSKEEKVVPVAAPMAIEIPNLGKLRKAKIWAVVIGVSKYTTTANLNLKYAKADADLFYNFLRSPSGGSIPAEQISLITNEKATRTEILKAMKSTFGKAYDTDVIILYIASHGQTENGEFYFLTTEAEPGFLDATALSRNSLAEAFNGKTIRAKKKIIFADACHSGELMKMELTRASGEGEMEREKSNQLLVEMAQSNEGCAIMTASTGGQKSYEDAKWGGGHGVFTYSLIEGLKGNADYDENKIVTLIEINEYVFRTVTEATQRKQQSSFQGTFDDHFPMSVVIK